MAFLARESGEVDFASQDAKDGEGLRTAWKMDKFFPLEPKPLSVTCFASDTSPASGRGKSVHMR